MTFNIDNCFNFSFFAKWTYQKTNTSFNCGCVAVTLLFNGKSKKSFIFDEF